MVSFSKNSKLRSLIQFFIGGKIMKLKIRQILQGGGKVVLAFILASIFVSCNMDDDNDSPKAPKGEDYVITVLFDESKIEVTKGFIDAEAVKNNSTVKAWETLNVKAKNFTEGKTLDYWKINGTKDEGTDKKDRKSFQVSAITKNECIEQEGKYIYSIEFEERNLYSAKVTYDTDYVICQTSSWSSSGIIQSGKTVTESDTLSTLYFNLKEEKISSDWTSSTKTYIYGYSLDGGTTEVYYPSTALQKRYYQVNLADANGKDINFKFLTKEPKSTTVSFGSDLKVSKTCYYRTLDSKTGDYVSKTEDVVSDETPIYEGEIIAIKLASGESAETAKIFVNGTSLEKFNKCPFLCESKDGDLKIIYSSSNMIAAKDGKFTIEYK